MRWMARAALATTTVVVVGASAAAAGPRLVERRVTVLDVVALVAAGGSTTELGRSAVEMEGGAAATSLSVPWPSGIAPTRLWVSVQGSVAAEDRLACAVEVQVEPSGTASPVHVRRSTTLSEQATSLIELQRAGGSALVLALTPRESVRFDLLEPTVGGEPVMLRLHVERVEGERIVPLEVNHLFTFVGEGVEYSFSRGSGASEETLRVVLTPLRLTADLAEIQVEVAGRLPGPDGGLLFDRRERVLTTRAASSEFLALAGDPPAGYRFRVTPEF